MLKDLGVAALLVFAVIWWSVWINAIGRAWLVEWLNKREKRQAHEDAVEELLQEHYSQDTIDWIVRNGRRKQTQGILNTFASIAAKQVHKWKEWDERDVDHDTGSSRI